MAWYEENTQQRGNFPTSLKLPAGESIVEVLGEPEFKAFPDFDNAEKQVDKAIFPVKYQEMTYAWIMTRTALKTRKGEPMDSLFAQLAAIAGASGGLAGAVLKVVRFGTGKGTRYLVKRA